MTGSTDAPIVFVGGPFKAHVDPASGLLEHRFRERYTRLINFFTDLGCSVRNAHREEGWGAKMATDTDCTARDYTWMLECDLFVAFPGDPCSPGTHIEIGWASAFGRPTVLLLEPAGNHAALVTGLAQLAHVALLPYKDGDDFLPVLHATVSDLASTTGTVKLRDRFLSEAA